MFQLVALSFDKSFIAAVSTLHYWSPLIQLKAALPIRDYYQCERLEEGVAAGVAGSLPTLWEIQMNLLAPGVGLIQACKFQAFGKRSNGVISTVSLTVCVWILCESWLILLK